MHAKNNLERQITGYSPSEKSVSYVFEIKALESVKIPKEIEDKIAGLTEVTA
jgi:hypothetical protein